MAQIRVCDICDDRLDNQPRYAIHVTGVVNQGDLSLGVTGHDYDICRTCYDKIAVMIKKEKGEKNED